MVEGFTAGQVCRLANVKFDTLDYWVTHGILEASVTPAAGKGTTRRFGFKDLITARVARELRQSGISLPALRKVADYLHDQQGLEHPLAEARLVVSGDDVLMVHDDQALVSALKQQGQGVMTAAVERATAKRRSPIVWIVDIAAVAQELRQAIAA